MCRTRLTKQTGISPSMRKTKSGAVSAPKNRVFPCQSRVYLQHTEKRRQKQCTLRYSFVDCGKKESVRFPAHSLSVLLRRLKQKQKQRTPLCTVQAIQQPIERRKSGALVRILLHTDGGSLFHVPVSFTSNSRKALGVIRTRKTGRRHKITSDFLTNRRNSYIIEHERCFVYYYRRSSPSCQVKKRKKFRVKEKIWNFMKKSACFVRTRG